MDWQFNLATDFISVHMANEYLYFLIALAHDLWDLHLYAMKWGDGMIWRSLNIEFYANIFTLLFHLQEAFEFLFTFCHKGGVICISEVMIFLLAILIPACASSSLAFRTMYSAYKLNKQGDNMQPWCTPIPIWNQSVAPCLVLLLLDLHTDFSGDEYGGLVLPSL